MEASRHRSLVGKNRDREMNEEGGDVAAEDVEVWETLSNSFKRAQVVLDKNRDLIQRVNENHMSRIPDNVARNVGLINEINAAEDGGQERRQRKLFLQFLTIIRNSNLRS